MEKNTFHIPFDLYSNRVKIIYFRLYFQNALLSSQDKIHPLSDTSKIIDHGNDQNRNNNSRRGIASPLETAPAWFKSFRGTGSRPSSRGYSKRVSNSRQYS